MCQRLVVRGSAGHGLSTISPSVSAQGDCQRCVLVASRRNRRMNMCIEIQNRTSVGSCNYPWSPVGSGERGRIAQCGVWRFLLWVDSGETGGLFPGLCHSGSEEPESVA